METRVLGLLLSFPFLASITIPADSQKLPAGLPAGSPTLDSFSRKGPVLTSSVLDAVTEVPFLDAFDRKDAEPLSPRPRAPNGSFLVKGGGHFIVEVESYCLKAGTHGPSRGRGYAWAPLKGSMASVIQTVLSRASRHPDVLRKDIQLLLWGILSRTKSARMPRPAAAAARKLLTTDEIRQIDGASADAVSAESFRTAIAMLPPAYQHVLRAERDLRTALARPQATYEQIEKLAVLAGEAPPEGEIRSIPRGRWSYHPRGYFIRYFPREYFRSVVEVYVPQDYRIERDGSGRVVAVLAPEGARLEVVYDDAAGPARQRGAASPASVLKTVSLRRDYGQNVGIGTVAVWQDAGWAFTRTPTSREAEPALSSRLTGFQRRYSRAVALQREMAALVKGIGTSGRRAARSPTDAETEEVLSIVHLADGLTGISIDAGPAERTGAVDPAMLLLKAWQSEFARMMTTVATAGGTFEPPGIGAIGWSWDGPERAYGPFVAGPRCGPGRDPDDGDEVDLGDGGGEPGQPGAQRLVASNRKTKADDFCAGQYGACKAMANDEWARCVADCFAHAESNKPVSRECQMACSRERQQDLDNCATLTRACLEGK